MTVREVAGYLNVDEKTVYRHTKWETCRFVRNHGHQHGDPMGISLGFALVGGRRPPDK